MYRSHFFAILYDVNVLDKKLLSTLQSLEARKTLFVSGTSELLFLKKTYYSLHPNRTTILNSLQNFLYLWICQWYSNPDHGKKRAKSHFTWHKISKKVCVVSSGVVFKCLKAMGGFVIFFLKCSVFYKRSLPWHLDLSMIFKANSVLVFLLLHFLTTAKFPSPIISPTKYLEAISLGGE